MLQKGTTNDPRMEGPRTVREPPFCDFGQCLPVFRECRLFSQKNRKTVDLHETLAGMVPKRITGLS